MPCRARRIAPLALLVVLASCTPFPAPTASPSTSATPSAGPITLRLLEAEDAQTLDPALIDDPVSLAIGKELFEGLTRLDASLRPQPGLAQRWDVQDAGRTYTFHLRAAHYHSGAAVVAQDAIADWSRALAPQTASPLATFFGPLGAHFPGDPLSGVQALDASTLRVTLVRPDSEFLTLLALPPYWLYDPASTSQPPAGSGPYVLDAWQHGRHLDLHAVSGGQLEPRVTKVSIDIEPDASRRLDAFRRGQADIVHGLAGPQLLDFARTPADLQAIHRVPTGRTTWLGFNAVAGSGYSQGERLAIAHAIDRHRLTDVAFFGSLLAIPATDLLPPGIPGHVDRSLPAFDPAVARKGLDDAGFPGPIDLSFSTNATVGRVARDLQDQIAKATARTVSLHPLGDFFNQASQDLLPVMIDTWSADLPHPADILDHILRGGAQFNNLHIDDPAINEALDRADTALTLDAALSADQRAEQFVVDDGRMIPLYSAVEPYLVRPGLRVPFVGSVVPYRWEDVGAGSG
ncbi:MAG TPA: ABC transporter substrate-binding protein [Candidatus Limnocylindrales bacterium]|nr:ABC transporter substrate-binding protein [Candidatus Limnocylindrales bacterium]